MSEAALGLTAGFLISIGTWLTAEHHRVHLGTAVAWVAALILSYGVAYPVLANTAGRWIVTLDPEAMSNLQIHSINVSLIVAIWVPFAIVAFAIRHLIFLPFPGRLAGYGCALSIAVLPGMIGLDIREADAVLAIGQIALLNTLLAVCAVTPVNS